MSDEFWKDVEKHPDVLDSKQKLDALIGAQANTAAVTLAKQQLRRVRQETFSKCARAITADASHAVQLTPLRAAIADGLYKGVATCSADLVKDLHRLCQCTWQDVSHYICPYAKCRSHRNPFRDQRTLMRHTEECYFKDTAMTSNSATVLVENLHHRSSSIESLYL
ncbi:hypothetical protein EAF04_008946 [Stromatinia cepivora]|nr:hypothetical protein EAF04_008946 [Stromatinia cepivora]